VVIRAAAAALAVVPVDGEPAVPAGVTVTNPDRDRERRVRRVTLLLAVPLDLLPRADVQELRVRDELVRRRPAPARLAEQARTDRQVQQDRCPRAPDQRRGAHVDPAVSEVAGGLLGEPVHEPRELVDDPVVVRDKSVGGEQRRVRRGVVPSTQPRHRHDLLKIRFTC
jgi:hypothetical protein